MCIVVGVSVKTETCLIRVLSITDLQFAPFADSTTPKNKKAEPNDPAFVVIYLILFGCLFLNLPTDTDNTD
jgi:hypothetical protein